MNTIRQLQTEVHQLARDKGWYDEEDGTYVLMTKLALIHSEVSEAVECVRNGDMQLRYQEKTVTGSDGYPRTYSTGKPEGFGIELADVLIRVLDLAEHQGIDMEEMVRIKHEYNKTRPHKHGGKRA